MTNLWELGGKQKVKGFATKGEKHEKNNHSDFLQVFYGIKELKSFKKSKVLIDIFLNVWFKYSCLIGISIPGQSVEGKLRGDLGALTAVLF